MISAVYDTNVLISGTLLRYDTPPAQILDMAVQGMVKLYTSEALIGEFHDVISRSKFAGRFQQIQRTPDDVIVDYRNIAEITRPKPMPPPVKDEPKDDKVLACAAFAQVDYIVSGDKKHLLPVGSYVGIPIVDPATFLETVSQ